MSAVLLLSFLSSLGLTAAWCQYSLRRNRLDVPNARSSHARPTPTSGGLGFTVVACLGAIALGWSGALLWREVTLLLLSVFIAIFGFVDDSRDLGIKTRLVVQIAVVAIFVFLFPFLPPINVAGFTLTHPVVLSVLVFTFGIWQINFYNFMDGIDGMAVSQGLFVSFALAWFCAEGGAEDLSLAALALASALLGFVPFNIPRARLFMGDVGSNFLGYIFLVLGVIAIARGALNYWTYLILMSAFLIDTTITLIARMGSGVVWYHGHRTHAYQLAARCYGSHGKIVWVYVAVNLAWLLPLAVLSNHYADLGVLIAFIAWAPLAITTWLVRRRFKEQDQTMDMSK